MAQSPSSVGGKRACGMQAQKPFSVHDLQSMPAVGSWHGHPVHLAPEEGDMYKTMLFRHGLPRRTRYQRWPQVFGRKKPITVKRDDEQEFTFEYVKILVVCSLWLLWEWTSCTLGCLGSSQTHQQLMRQPRRMPSSSRRSTRATSLNVCSAEPTLSPVMVANGETNCLEMTEYSKFWLLIGVLSIRWAQGCAGSRIHSQDPPLCQGVVRRSRAKTYEIQYVEDPDETVWETTNVREHVEDAPAIKEEVYTFPTTTGMTHACVQQWVRAKKEMNRWMHYLHGNGGPSCSSTWPWADESDDDSRYNGVLSSPSSPMPMRTAPWMPGRRVDWQPPLQLDVSSQDWPVTIKGYVCGELLEIHTSQHATIGHLLGKAADSLMVSEWYLVAIDAGDILPRRMTVENLAWIDIDFRIEGAGCKGDLRPSTSRRSRSRTPARSTVPREIAVIQPNPEAVEDSEPEPAYLIVAHTLPKGRKYYPMYFKLADKMSVVRWEFGRVARRGVATFSFWQGERRFREHEEVRSIDRSKYLEVWRTAALDDDAADPDHPLHGEAREHPQPPPPAPPPLAVTEDPYMCPECSVVKVQVQRLEQRIDFIEELLEVKAEDRPTLRLRGGGRRKATPPPPSEASHLPEAYEEMLQRTQQLCPQFAKAQLRTLLRSDSALCPRLKKVDDASLIRIMVAAGKRNGMQTTTDHKPSSSSQRTSSVDEKASCKTKEKKAELALGESDQVDDDQIPVLTLLSTFDVPTVTSLRPGESGVLLGEGEEVVAKLLTRFAGSNGSAAVITPARYNKVAIEPKEMVLQFRKTVKDQPDLVYTALAYLYRLTSETPSLKEETPVVKIQPKRRSMVLGMEVLQTRETIDVCNAIACGKARLLVHQEAPRKPLG